MKDTRIYRIWPSNLSLPAAFKELAGRLAATGYAPKDEGHSGIHHVEIDSTRKVEAVNWAEFLTVVDSYPNPKRIHVISDWINKETKEVEVSVVCNTGGIEVAVDSREIAVLELLHRYLQESFRASNPTPSKSKLLPQNLKRSVFLAHRFDESGQTTAAIVRKFLEQCRFSVLEGQGYQAGAIPAKIGELIDQQDVLLAIFTAGDCTWISSEAAFAHAKRKYVLCLAEEGLDIKKGILGADYEHLVFRKGFVEKSFSDLLHALP